MASAALPGHWEPSCPASELRPFLLFPLARACRRVCWNTEEKAQRLPALPRSCKQPCRDYCHNIHPFQQESCQEWVAGSRPALGKENVPNKGCSDHAGVFIAFLCSQEAGRAPADSWPKSKWAGGTWPCQAVVIGHGTEKVVSFPG